MKIMMFYARRTVMGMISCLLALGLFSCEPEVLETQTELNSKTAVKKAQKNLPHKEIAQVRRAVAPYHNFQKALDAHWEMDITGYIPHMGHHWLNAEEFDSTFEMLTPSSRRTICGCRNQESSASQVN